MARRLEGVSPNAQEAVRRRAATKLGVGVESFMTDELKLKYEDWST